AAATAETHSCWYGSYGPSSLPKERPLRFGQVRALCSGWYVPPGAVLVNCRAARPWCEVGVPLLTWQMRRIHPVDARWSLPFPNGLPGLAWRHGIIAGGTLAVHFPGAGVGAFALRSQSAASANANRHPFRY